MKTHVFCVSSFKKRLDSIVIQKSGDSELITFTDFLKMKINGS